MRDRCCIVGQAIPLHPMYFGRFRDTATNASCRDRTVSYDHFHSDCLWRHAKRLRPLIDGVLPILELLDRDNWFHQVRRLSSHLDHHPVDCRSQWSNTQPEYGWYSFSQQRFRENLVLWWNYHDVVWTDCHLFHDLESHWSLGIVALATNSKLDIPRYCMVLNSPWLAISFGTPFQAGEADVIQYSPTSHPPRLTPRIGVRPALMSSFSCWRVLFNKGETKGENHMFYYPCGRIFTALKWWGFLRPRGIGTKTNRLT